eukprot:TRINITY_DN21483_c0_g2_i2.p1 TRINITY_DN21483_c0_g2~~TRINITY_DN21483_c0_g2_i2.p1  ORF type:complete len:239 (+),score=22.47 TRINITY_DN21483_c0_g2_i2:41-757(+)
MSGVLQCVSFRCGKPRHGTGPYCLKHHQEQENFTYGLDNDVKQKLAAKYDPAKAELVQAWVETVLEEKFTEGSLQGALKSGVRLCNLINKIKPGCVTNISKLTAPFKQRENIEKYLTACSTLGMKSLDLFVTGDLFEGSNLVVVVDNIYNLAKKAKEIGANVPDIGGTGGGSLYHTVPSTPKSTSSSYSASSWTPTVPATPSSASSTVFTSDMIKFCPRCGRKREESGRFCATCGYKF